jgi:hypothetical protein
MEEPYYKMEELYYKMEEAYCKFCMLKIIGSAEVWALGLQSKNFVGRVIVLERFEFTIRCGSF